jgi:hypothetical protein
MALKDWKKKKGFIVGQTRFRNDKKNVDLLIMKTYGRKGYEIYLYGSHLNNMGEETLAKRKTKSQALRYARAYMRKH